MLRHERSAPIWLFSFVDLAFLLLIAFTQIGPRDAADAPDLATLEIPRIHGPGTPTDLPASAALWQLRVHPVDVPLDATAAHLPFVLVEPGTDPAAAALRDASDLGHALSLLGDRGLPKPILAPHRDARAEDLLVAVALLDEHWRGDRTTAVRPDAPIASPSDPNRAPTDVAGAPTEAR
ncbi:MAG: hypothetical protein AAGC67_13985 [Myxococcota bacterium]